jgi:hypothetical protein
MNRWHLSAILPLAVSVGIFWILDPALLFAPTTPTGGDLGLHVYPFARGVEGILAGRGTAGWDPGWFAGFPRFYFYFPLPAWLVAALTPVVGFEVGLKLVVVTGLIALPFVSYFLARQLGLGPFESGFAAALGGAFVFMEDYSHLGANIYSTLVGEFAYSISFTLSLLFIGLVTRFLGSVHVQAPRWDQGPEGAGDRASLLRLATALVLAATALSHVLTTMAAVVASAPLLLRAPSRRFVLLAWSGGFAFSAFWAIPFLVRSPWMGYLRWHPATDLQTLLPVELWFLLPGAIIGLVVVWRLGWPAVPFLTLTGLAVALFLIPSGLEMRDRFLPYWYFGIHFLAGAALGRGLALFLAHRSGRALTLAAGMAVLVVGLFTLRDVTSVRTAAAETLGGYESKPAWPEYAAFMDSLAALPPGRLAWQTDTSLTRYGSIAAPALAPYWSPDHPSLDGLLIESSPTGPYALRLLEELSPEPFVSEFRGDLVPVPFDFERGVRHLGVFGVRYFATFTRGGTALAEQSPQLTSRVATDEFGIFEVRESALVTPATHVPTVLDGPFLDAADAWFDRDRRLDEWLVDDGPTEWPRRSGSPVTWPPAPEIGGPVGQVAVVEEGDEHLTFRTEAVGVPHMVRVSWFPNWTAEGADGPWRAAPSLMVVVPRQETVTLAFRRTWVEWLGWGTTAGAILVLVTVGVRRLPWRRS